MMKVSILMGRIYTRMGNTHGMNVSTNCRHLTATQLHHHPHFQFSAAGIPPSSQTLVGSILASQTAKHVTEPKNAYTAYPCSRFFSTDREKSDVASAGPMERAIETVVCERPFVAPNERLFGAEAVINMKIVPVRR